jgi:glutaredoxin
MAEERGKRRDEPAGGQSNRGAPRNIIILALIVAAFAVTYYLGRRHRTHRLDAFAQCLTGKRVKMYGAFWCPHCADQKQLFESSFQYVPYVECGIKGSRAENETCLQAGVKRFPTWEFADGERREGVLTPQALSQKTGCSLP